MDATVILRISDGAVGLTGWGWFVLILAGALFGSKSG